MCSSDLERYRKVEAARRAEQDLMVAYERLEAPACRMAFLRAALNDPVMAEGWRCGCCDLCGGLVLDVGTAVKAREAAQKKPRKQGVCGAWKKWRGWQDSNPRPLGS